MKRRFIPIDEAALTKEWRDLRQSSESDAAKLRFCIKRYEDCGDGLPSPAVIKNFGDNLMEIRHESSRYAGRGFFSNGKWSPSLHSQVLWLLCVFRKESQRTPSRYVELARSRNKRVKRDGEDLA